MMTRVWSVVLFLGFVWCWACLSSVMSRKDCNGFVRGGLFFWCLLYPFLTFSILAISTLNQWGI